MLSLRGETCWSLWNNRPDEEGTEAYSKGVECRRHQHARF